MTRVQVPHRNTFVDFPEGTPVEEMSRAITEAFPRNGADVKEDLQDRSFKPEEDDFKLYEDYLKSDDNDTPWTQLMYDAAGHLLSTAGSAVAGAVTAPHKIPGSVVEGAAQGTQALYQMAAQSEDPDSWAFKLKDKLFNSGTLHERHQMFLKARDFTNKVEKNTSGEETLVMPKAAVDNRLVQGFATVLDPTVIVPGVGEVLGVGRLAARATAKAAIGVGRGLRAVAAPVNSALRVAGEGVAKATGLTAHEMQIAAGAAGAGALANPIGQAVVGTVAAAKGADIVGDTLTRVGRVMRDQPTRIAPFESVALDATAPKNVQRFANLAHRLGGDVALDIAPGAVAGMAEGAAVGGALGYYNSGEEGAASGIGGGIAAGGVAAGGVRAVQHLTGHVNVERGRAGGKALVDGLKDGEVIGMDTVETTDASGNKVNTQVARTSNSKTLAQRLVARMGYFAKGGEGMVADFFTHAAEDGTQVVLIDKDTTLPSSFGISSPEDMRGVAITRQVDGKPVIVIHVDNATKDTAGHELFHTLLGEASKSEMKRIGSSKLFGIPGISKGLTSARDLHAWTVNHVKKMAALGNAGWQRAVDTVFNVDPNTKEVTLRTDVPPAKMLEAQHMIADEILAEYGGYDIFGRTLTGRATYSGQLRRDKVNTVFESIAALARDTWMRTTEGQVARDGIFNTETKSLLDSKGKLNRNRELSKFMREVVTRDNSLSEDAVRTRIEFKDTKNLDAINEQLGAGSLFELDNNGKVSRVITPNEDKARGITRHAEVKAELDKIAEHERGVRRSLDENGDEVFNFENATDAELAAVLKFLNPIQQDNVRKIIEGIASRDGQPIHIVTNFAALAKGRNGRNQYRGLAPSERKAILYGLELSKEGNFYARVLDYDQVSRNIAKALRVPEYSKLWANPSDIIVDLKKYLEHLTKSDKPDSAAMFGLNGEAKRSFFYEVLGVQPAPTKGAFPERPYRAGFTHSSKDSPFRSMRIDRISRIEATGEKAFFNEAQTHHNAQRNYQPADTVRLYRVEQKDLKDKGEWLKKHLTPAQFSKFQSERGRLFADSVEALRNYGWESPETNGFSVDVPRSVAEAAKRKHPDGFNEYLLPQEVVDGKSTRYQPDDERRIVYFDKAIKTPYGSRYYHLTYGGDWYKVRLSDHSNQSGNMDGAVGTESLFRKSRSQQAGVGMDSPHLLNVLLKEPVKTEADAKKVVARVLRGLPEDATYRIPLWEGTPHAEVSGNDDIHVDARGETYLYEFPPQDGARRYGVPENKRASQGEKSVSGNSQENMLGSGSAKTGEGTIPRFQPSVKSTDPSRFKAEKLGDTEVHTHESGARVLVKGNVNRVYAADGALLGVTNNDAKAEKLLAKHLEKTTPRYSLLSDADMPAMVDSLPEIDLSELVGKKIAPILADRTMVGTYRGIDSSRVEPVRMTGGVRFPEIKANHEKRVVWASNKDIRNTDVADYHLVGFMEENSHRSNASTIGAMVNTIEAYARDGRISKNGVKLADVEVRRITGDRSAPSVASKEFEAYADKHNMSFEMRKNIADTLTKAKFEKLGFPSMERVLRHTIEPSHSGYNWGDMFLLVKVDKGSPRVPLGVNGVPSHESYKHGQPGTLVAKMSKAVSHDILFSEFFDRRRAAGAETAHDVRSFYLAEPVTTVTAEKVAASGSKTKYTAIRNPKHAAMAVDAALGEWRTSDTAVKDGGVGVVDFVRAIQQSDHAASLSNFTPNQVKKMVSRGELKIYQLGDAQVFFALKNMKGGGKELVSVVSNELAGKGVAAPAVMIKAIEEGATNLDCFALKSSKHPAGFLPELYSLFGFAKVGDEITFSEAHYLAGDYAKRSQHELRDLKHSWESTGWKPEHGDPTVVSMQLELSNDNRRNYRRDYIQPAPRALADAATTTGLREGASAQPHSGHSREGGAGSTDARPHSGTEGNLRGRDLDRPNPRVAFNRVIDEVLSLDAGDIRNLKLDQKKVEALRKFRDSTARYSYGGEKSFGFQKAKEEGRVFIGKYDKKPRFEIDDSGATADLKPLYNGVSNFSKWTHDNDHVSIAEINAARDHITKFYTDKHKSIHEAASAEIEAAGGVSQMDTTKLFAMSDDIDNQVSFDNGHLRSYINGDRYDGYVPLETVFKNDELFQNYPAARFIAVGIRDLGANTLAHFDSSDRIAVNARVGIDSIEARSSILHEVQHWIQREEGFAKGSSGEDGAYSEVAGEIEARDVQARSHLTKAERVQSLKSARSHDVVRSKNGDGWQVVSPRGVVVGLPKTKDAAIAQARALDVDEVHRERAFGRGLPVNSGVSGYNRPHDSQRIPADVGIVRYQPFSEASTETLGDVTVTTDRSGMKMTQRGSGAARLYAADGRLIGVYTGVSEAIRKASRVAAAKELRRD